MAAKLLDEISRKLERMEADWAAAREAAREKQDRAFHKLNEALAAIAAQLVEESEVVGGDIVSQDDKLAELEAIDASKVDEAIAHSVAHKVLDEMPKPVTDLKTVQVSDLSDASTLLAVNKEFTGLMKDLEELSLQDGLSFDPGGKFRVDLAWNFNVSGDDDVWTVERPIVDDVLMMGEQLAQMETIDGSNVEKEVVDSVAHRMPDEMPKLIFSFNAISDTPILPGAPSIGVVMSEFGQKFIFDSKPVVTDCENFACSASITMWVAYNRVGSVMFDPGGVKVAYVYFAIRLSNGLCADLCCHLRVDSEFSKTQAAQANIKSVMFHPSCVRMPTIDPHLPRCESFSNHLVFQLGKCIECTGAKVADFIRSPGVLSKLVADDRSYRTLVFMKIIMASKCIRLSFAQMLSLVGGLAIEGFRSDSCSMQIFEIFDPGGQLLMHFDESFLKEFSLASVSIGFSFQSLIWNFPPHMEFWEAEFSETKAVVSIQLSSNKLQFLGKEDAAEFELIPFDHGRGLHTADCVDDGENLTFDEGFEPLVFHPQNIFNVQWGIKAKITSTHGGSVAYKNGAKFVDVNGDLVGKFQLRSLKEAQKNLQQSTFIYGELRNERWFSFELDVHYYSQWLAACSSAQLGTSTIKNILNCSVAQLLYSYMVNAYSFDYARHIWGASIESKLELESSFYLRFDLQEVSIFGTSLVQNYAQIGRLTVFVKCSYFDVQLLVFDPGITIREECKGGAVIDATSYGCVTYNFLLGFDTVDEEKLKMNAYKETKINLHHSIIVGGIILYTPSQEKINAKGEMRSTFQLLTYIATGSVIQLWAANTNVNFKIDGVAHTSVADFWAEWKASAVYYHLQAHPLQALICVLLAAMGMFGGQCKSCHEHGLSWMILEDKDLVQRGVLLQGEIRGDPYIMLFLLYLVQRLNFRFMPCLFLNPVLL